MWMTTRERSAALDNAPSRFDGEDGDGPMCAHDDIGAVGVDAAEPLTQAIAAVMYCLHFLRYGFVPEPAFRAKRAQSCAGNPLSVL